MSQEAAKVVEALRKKLGDYRSKRPNLSIRSIAKHANVNRYFLNKVIHEDLDKITSLDFSQILMLSKFLTSSDSLKATIDNSSEEIRNLLLKAFDADYECGFAAEKVLDKPLESIDLDDFDIFLILIMSASSSTSRKMLENSLMKKSHGKIDELIEKGFLKNDVNDTVTLNGGSLPNIPHSAYVKHIPEIIKRFYSPEKFGSGRNFIGLYHQNINEETLLKLREIHKDFAIQVNSLIDDPKNKGPISAFTTFCTDCFIEP